VSTLEKSRSAIADKLRCHVCKLWQKYKCEKRASNPTLLQNTLKMLNRLGVHISYKTDFMGDLQQML